jgi:hypothetical protein
MTRKTAALVKAKVRQADRALDCDATSDAAVGAALAFAGAWARMDDSVT